MVNQHMFVFLQFPFYHSNTTVTVTCEQTGVNGVEHSFMWYNTDKWPVLCDKLYVEL